MAKEINNIGIWQGPNGINFPASVNKPEGIMPYAASLSLKQQNQIVAAFQIEAFDMASEYAWKKAMVKLKETIATLGMKFVGEMLGRNDFDNATQIDEISDYSAIQLAEQLGVIGTTAALKLKHCNELITHFFSKNADEQLDYITAINIVKSSVQYILGEQDISIAMEFSNFRKRLQTEILKSNDQHVEQIIHSPLFYLRTVVTILLSSIKEKSGAVLENALSNLNLIIEPIWEKLGENDKYSIGMAYRDVVSAGNAIAVAGLKQALLKVNGFDYVPENLRSSTYIQTAKQVIDTHYAANNFYNEPNVVAKLASLGTSIPGPALPNVLQAYLAVTLGNSYNVSYSARDIAVEELSKLSREKWNYYFEKLLQNDEVILNKASQSQLNRFGNLLIVNGITNLDNLPKYNKQYYDAVITKNFSKAQTAATNMLTALRKGHNINE